MNLSRTERIEILHELGNRLAKRDAKLRKACEQAYQENPWFIPQYIDQSIKAICQLFLQKELLSSWIDAYKKPGYYKKIGLILAGNIPLVGFHDFLTVFMSGHKALLKLSSKDEKLFNYILEELNDIDQCTGASFEVVDRLKDFDAVIATGSNNSSRYFDYYFGKYPNIIRKNRNGVAVLTGEETDEQLRMLGSDIFNYFGLGCRNVTKLYVPESYGFDKLLKVLDEFETLSNHNKYKNNFDYNYALFLLNKEEFLANNTIILREDPAYISRIACLHYENYNDLDNLKNRLESDQDLIQCICTVNGEILGIEKELIFGNSQIPGLCDYADGVDTMEFLSTLA